MINININKKIMKTYLISMKRLFLFILFIQIISTVYSSTMDWSKADSIVADIVVPVFKNKTYSIIKYGAINDGVTDCTDAFRKAIQECNKRGGGRVLVPRGQYQTGAIHLLSNVNLHLEEGAEILFSRDMKKYLPLVLTRFGGIDLMNYSPFIYAFEQKNIAVTGKGILNGQANDTTWWHWTGRMKSPKLQAEASKRLHQQAQKNVPVEKRIYGEGSYIRTNFVQPYKCENILIEGITLINSPAWVLHPVLCKNISIIDVKINSKGPNNDGLDPESCNGVYVSGCSFRTGDDCIAIKAGKDADGRSVNVPCENIVIRNCSFQDGHGAIGIGSEMTGGVRNVFAENCTMNSPKLDRVVRLKTNTDRGGFIENVFVRNCIVEETGGSVVDVEMFYYDDKRTGKYYTKIKNIQIENVVSKKSKYGIKIIGSDSIPVENILIKNCRFENVKFMDVIEGVKNFKIAHDNTLQSVSPYPIGTAISLKYLKTIPKYRELVISEFNSLTPEVEMKMTRIRTKPDLFDFSDADAFVNFALQYNKRIHGHALIWNSVPEWLSHIDADSVYWNDYMKNYVHTVVGRYKGKIAAWDVVCEAIDDNGNINMDNIWAKKIGVSYIEKAFLYAHQADPDAILFYNDYGHEYSDKRLNGILKLIQDLRKKGIPVHGIGMQMHTRYDLGDERWEKAIKACAATGLQIHISELDISMNQTEKKADAVFTKELAYLQKEKYKFIVNTYNALPDSVKYGVTTWGVGDANSWLKSKPDWPLLFDVNYDKKPAYDGVKEAMKNVADIVNLLN